MTTDALNDQELLSFIISQSKLSGHGSLEENNSMESFMQSLKKRRENLLEDSSNPSGIHAKIWIPSEWFLDSLPTKEILLEFYKNIEKNNINNEDDSAQFTKLKQRRISQLRSRLMQSIGTLPDDLYAYLYNNTLF